MKLLIASDLHGSFTQAEVLADLVRSHHPSAVVLLGDLLYHGPRNPLPQGYDPASTAECLNAFADRIIAVRGNCDSDVDQMLLDFRLAPEYSWILTDTVRVLATHGHLSGFGNAPSSSPTAPKTAVLSGHTHVPEARCSGGVHFWNPGSLALPKQQYPPSYAIYEHGVFRVLDISGNLLMEDGV